MHGGKSIADVLSGLTFPSYPHMHGGKSVAKRAFIDLLNCYPHMHGGKSGLEFEGVNDD